MVRRIKDDVVPDADDLDGQIGKIDGTSGDNNGSDEKGNGESVGRNSGEDNRPNEYSGSIDPRNIAGSEVDNSDDYARNPDGSIKRNKDGSPSKKRGRKAGIKLGEKPRTTNSQNLRGAIDSLSNILGFVHVGLAVVSKCPELELDKSESDALANATANVLAQFDVEPDPRVTAIFGLLTVCGTIYGPRYYLISKRKEKEREEKTETIAVNPNANSQFDPGAYNLGG